MLLLSAAKFFASFKIKHPKIDHKPIIDYNLILILMASSMLGSLIGSLIAPGIPDLLQLIMLIIFISISLFLTYPKTLKMYAAETLEINRKKMIVSERPESDVDNIAIELKNSSDFDGKKKDIDEKYILQKETKKNSFNILEDEINTTK